MNPITLGISLSFWLFVSILNPEPAAAHLYTSDRGIIDGTWQLGGDDLTPRGDRVVWEFYYADPDQVAWSSPDNPDLFVKMWFDHSGSLFSAQLYPKSRMKDEVDGYSITERKDGVSYSS